MTQDETITVLTEWRDALVNSDTTCSDLLGPLKIEPKSPLYQTIWSLQGHYTRAVAALVGDRSEWMEWFCFDNAMGKNEHEASPGASYPMRKIKTINDLAKLIQESK